MFCKKYHALYAALIGASVITLSACDEASTQKLQSFLSNQHSTAKSEPNAKSSDSVATQAELPVQDDAPPKEPAVVQAPNTSQQFRGDSEIEKRLAEALPEIAFSTDSLSADAIAINQAVWRDPAELAAQQQMEADTDKSASASVDGQASAANANSVDSKQLNQVATKAGEQQSTNSKEATAKAVQTAQLSRDEIVKIQALLNWNHHGVGAVDGKFSKNTIKAMNVFQEKHGLQVTETMNAETWAALTKDANLSNQPAMVSYKLTKEDVSLPRHPRGQQYRTVKEAIAEKFHMSEALLSELNKDIPLKEGSVITVYNPSQPNMKPVTRVKVDRKANILYAYDATGELVASYPTTVGAPKPTPAGKYTVTSRVIDPYYNKTPKNKNATLPPGPNNPVGRVWLGISKPTYGIHGSPQPEMISKQSSAGCVRLTNWDVLGLYGVIQEGAEVEIL